MGKVFNFVLWQLPTALVFSPSCASLNLNYPRYYKSQTCARGVYIGEAVGGAIGGYFAASYSSDLIDLVANKTK